MQASLLALLAASAAALAFTCAPQNPRLGPAPGVPEYRAPALVAVPGARVDVAGLNLVLTREDLSIDTRIGGHRVGATYNSADDAWTWTFDVSYDGTTFVDDSGARFDTTGLVSGEAIPGTWWVVLDGQRLRTKGGLVHEFAPEGYLAAVYWASDPYPRVETRARWVAGALRVNRFKQCAAPGTCEDLYQIERDDLGRPVGLRDRADRRCAYAWDAQGRLVAARDALDVARGWPGQRYEYGPDGLAARTSSEGERVEYAWSGESLEVRAIGEGDPTWRFLRQPRQGDLYRTRFTDPLGHETHFAYDAERRLRSLTSPLDETTLLEWEGLRPSRLEAADGTAVRWTWQDDDLVSELQPGGNLVQLAYQPSAVDRAAPLRSPRAWVQDSLGVVEAREYDAAGRLVRVQNGAGEVLALAYDAAGSLQAITAPDGRTLELGSYGPHGHPEAVIVDGTSYARSFDAVGNLLVPALIEPDLPGVQSRSYDEDRNPILIMLASQANQAVDGLAPLWLDYRSDHRLRSATRAELTPATEWVYDALGRLSERRERVAGSWLATRFEWDAAGRAVAVQAPDGAREERLYDAAGRPVWRAFGRGSPLVVESALSFDWMDGRLASLHDSGYAGPHTYAYDGAGRLARVEFPEGEALALAWDERSRLAAIALEDPGTGFAAELGVAYDGAGREVAVALDGAPLLERSLSAGRLAEVRYGNGLVRSFVWGTGLERTTATRDAAGSLVAETSLVDEGGSEGPACLRYRADALAGVLASRDEAWCQTRAANPRNAAPSGDPGAVWTAFGDATALEGRALTYNADATRLLEVREQSGGALVHDYAYDAAGRVVDRDGQPMAWDAAGRLTSAGPGHALRWDAAGRPLEETDAEGTRRWRFGGLVEADANGVPVALDLGEVRIDLVAGQHRYRHFDARGNVRFVTDTAGAVRTLYGYRGFGVASVAGADDDPVRFALGRQVGDLVRLGHRVLDPDAGRFLAPDPVHQVVNQYVYAHGNSILWWDPSGLEGTLHGLTAEQWAAAVAFGGASAGLVALALGVASGGPAAAAFIASALYVVHANGGFPWEGDRTIGDLLKKLGNEVGDLQRRLWAASGSPAGPLPVVAPALSPPPVAGIPSSLDLAEDGPPPPPIRLWGLNDGGIAVCAPGTLGGRANPRVLAALICVNLVLGFAVLRRHRGGR